METACQSVTVSEQVRGSLSESCCRPDSMCSLGFGERNTIQTVKYLKQFDIDMFPSLTEMFGFSLKKH